MTDDARTSPLPTDNDRLALPDLSDDEAAREYGRQLAMDGILDEALVHGPVLRARARRRRVSLAVALPLAAAAAVLLAVTVGGPDETTAPPRVITDATTPAAEEPDDLARTGSPLVGARVTNAIQGFRDDWGGSSVYVDDVLVEGDRVTTGPVGRVALAFADGTGVVAGANTTLSITSLAPKEIVLSAGSVEASVAPQPRDRPMAFDMPDARVNVVGTDLTVMCDRRGSGVEVRSGAVRVTRLSDGAAVTLRAGRSALVAMGVAFAPSDRRLARLIETASTVPASPLVEPATTGDTTRDLVAWYRFDEGRGRYFRNSAPGDDARHFDGRIVDGTGRAGTHWSWTSGVHGGAIRFTPERGATKKAHRGSGGTVRIPSELNVIGLRRNHTIAAWVKFDDDQPDDGVTPILTQPGWINGLTRFTDKAVAGVFDGTGHFVGAGWRTPLSTGAWHHAVAAFDISRLTMSIYIDGRRCETAEITAPVTVQGRSVWQIGGYPGHGGLSQITIDDLCVYDRLLSPEEIRALADRANLPVAVQ